MNFPVSIIASLKKDHNLFENMVIWAKGSKLYKCMLKYFIGFVRYCGDDYWLYTHLKQFRRLAYWICHDWYWVGYRLRPMDGPGQKDSLW